MSPALNSAPERNVPTKPDSIQRIGMDHHLHVHGVRDRTGSNRSRPGVGGPNLRCSLQRTGPAVTISISAKRGWLCACPCPRGRCSSHAVHRPATCARYAMGAGGAGGGERCPCAGPVCRRQSRCLTPEWSASSICWGRRIKWDVAVEIPPAGQMRPFRRKDLGSLVR